MAAYPSCKKGSYETVHFGRFAKGQVKFAWAKSYDVRQGKDGKSVHPFESANTVRLINQRKIVETTKRTGVRSKDRFTVATHKYIASI